MTELVYVPRKLMKEWLKKGWGIVSDTYPAPTERIILMHPPGWVNPMKRLEKKEEDSG